MASENTGVMHYPTIRREPTNFTFEHGAQVVNTYNWLENTTSPEVKDFELNQNVLTFEYLKECPHRNEIKTNLSNMSKFKRMSCPTENPQTGDLFFFMNEENDDRDLIYRQTGLKGKPKLFLSPKQIVPFSSSNSRARLPFVFRMFSVSPSGKVIAYAYSLKNSNWMYIRFKQVETGVDYPEVLRNVCHSDISWTRDQFLTGIIGIVYSCYLNPNEAAGHKIAFHELGTDQKNDKVYVEFPLNSGITLQAQISDCGDMIFVTAQENIETKVYTHFFYGDLELSIKSGYEISPILFHLLEGENLDIQYITNHNCITYFRTNLRALNFRIVKTNLLFNDVLTKGIWETIIPNDHSRLLDWAVCVNRHYLMVCYIEEATHKLQLHTLETGQVLHEYSLPIGTITDYFGFRQCSHFFFTFSSFLIPDRVLYIKVPSNENCCCKPLVQYVYKKVQTFNKDLGTHYDELSKYRVKRHFCFSPRDGEAVPIFLIHRKRMKRDGSSPCIIYGQGCFGVQVMPAFSIPKLFFLQCFDGIIAVVGVRGGGEYGARWYVAGNKLKKQTTYDDFIAASEYLIKKRYTSPSKLIVEGQLFGGNLAAACLTQRPDLFAAVIIHDGLLDLMRYQMFHESGQYLNEFGDPEIPLYFENLEKLSPLQHILNENTILNIPGVMLVIGKLPSLSHPSNSFKFVTELQYTLGSKSTQHNPFLLCSKAWDESSGQVRGRLEKIEERAYIYSFLIQCLGLKYTTDSKNRKSYKSISQRDNEIPR